MARIARLEPLKDERLGGERSEEERDRKWRRRWQWIPEINGRSGWTFGVETGILQVP